MQQLAEHSEQPLQTKPMLDTLDNDYVHTLVNYRYVDSDRHHHSYSCDLLSSLHMPSLYFLLFCFYFICMYLLTSPPSSKFFFFFFNDTAPPEIYPFPLHDPLPIAGLSGGRSTPSSAATGAGSMEKAAPKPAAAPIGQAPIVSKQPWSHSAERISSNRTPAR